MYKYKIKNGTDAFLPGIGATVGGVITTEYPIENANFELIETQQPEQASVVATEAPQPNVITEAAPIAPTEAPQPTLTNEEIN